MSLFSLKNVPRPLRVASLRRWAFQAHCNLESWGPGLAGEALASLHLLFWLFKVEPRRGPACWGGLEALHMLEGHFCFLLCEKDCDLMRCQRVEGIIQRQWAFLQPLWNNLCSPFMHIISWLCKFQSLDIRHSYAPFSGLHSAQYFWWLISLNPFWKKQKTDSFKTLGRPRYVLSLCMKLND